MSSKVYEVVTDQIIKSLEKGVVPWRKPWTTNGIGHQNLSTGREYRGVNPQLLTAYSIDRGYTEPYWVTFNQAKKMGGQVRKGEKSNVVVFWRIFEKEQENVYTGEKEIDKIPMLRYYRVFNIAQVDGLDAPEAGPMPAPGATPKEAGGAVWRAYADPPELVHGGDRAFYVPVHDRITIPNMEQFTSTEGYYQVLYHEATHSTGHRKRLNREGVAESHGGFGSKPYSREELIAEMGSAFLMARAGLEPDYENSASYVKGWLKPLKDDPKLVVQAASKAQKAAEHIYPTQKPEKEVTA